MNKKGGSQCSSGKLSPLSTELTSSLVPSVDILLPSASFQNNSRPSPTPSSLVAAPLYSENTWRMTCPDFVCYCLRSDTWQDSTAGGASDLLAPWGDIGILDQRGPPPSLMTFSGSEALQSIEDPPSRGPGLSPLCSGTFIIKGLWIFISRLFSSHQVTEAGAEKKSCSAGNEVAWMDGWMEWNKWVGRRLWLRLPLHSTLDIYKFIAFHKQPKCAL